MPLRKKSDFTLHAQDYLSQPEKKALFTKRLFTDVAEVYDRFTLGPVSLFQDARWKQWMITNIPAIPKGAMVDLATGTGDLAYVLSRRFANAAVTGIDLTDAMLVRAHKKYGHTPVVFQKMDMGHLAFKNNSIALCTGGYALRNAPHLETFLENVYAMLAPGGIAAFLDFSKSSLNWWHRFTLAIMRMWLLFWSFILHGNIHIYDYIPQSLQYFPDSFQLRELFSDSGFSLVKRKAFLFGLVEVIIVRKPDRK